MIKENLFDLISTSYSKHSKGLITMMLLRSLMKILKWWNGEEDKFIDIRSDAEKKADEEPDPGRFGIEGKM